MAKDSYWFRHDSTAGRGLKIRKLQHIYGHEGKGIYWDVIEILREQSDYTYSNEESDLQMLSDIIGCKDVTKFINWFKDCVKLELFEINEKRFFCPPLTENMTTWETHKRNGSQPKAKRQAKSKRKGSIRGEEKRGYKKREEKIFIPPSVDEVVVYFRENGYEEWLAKKAFNHYAVADWHDKNGEAVKNWKQKMGTNWFKDEGKIQKPKLVH